MKTHLVTIWADGIAAKRDLLNWPKARGVSMSESEGGELVRHLLPEGMLCEIDGDDFEEAQTLGLVTVIGTKVDGIPVELPH